MPVGLLLTGLVVVVLPLVAAAGPCQVPTRSRAVIREFRASTPCPPFCATYRRTVQGAIVPYQRCGACEVDHVCPLACCGADRLENLQWMDAEANRRKGADCRACPWMPGAVPREP
jgi:hypothetical protein